MKIGAAIAIMVLLAATLLGGCPKSSTLVDNSQKPGNVLPSEGDTSAPSDVEQGTPDAGK